MRQTLVANTPVTINGTGLTRLNINHRSGTIYFSRGSVPTTSRSSILDVDSPSYSFDLTTGSPQSVTFLSTAAAEFQYELE